MGAGVLFDALPELMQASEALFRRIACNKRTIDRTDRGANHPIGFNAGFVQRLIDAGLVGTQRTAALQYQHNLAG